MEASLSSPPHPGPWSPPKCLMFAAKCAASSGMLDPWRSPEETEFNKINNKYEVIK
jgi:hypothetical protein